MDGFSHCLSFYTALNVEKSCSWRGESSGHVLVTRVLAGVCFLMGGVDRDEEQREMVGLS